jgi:hypothetical protein
MIYKTRESCIVTNRGKVVGTYNPSNTTQFTCEGKKFSRKECLKDATYFIRATKDDFTINGNLCPDCYREIKVQENNDPGLKLEERML